jgi:Flp pilus assembly protein TadB
LIGGVAGLVAGFVLGVVAWIRLGRLEPASVVRDREQIATMLPLAADLMVAALSAGAPPEHAVAAVGETLPGPLGRHLCAVAAALRVGTEPEAAWAELATEPPLRPLARVMANAAKRGTSPVSSLERIARDSEDVARWTAEARARSVGARAAVPLGLCFLPAFILVGVVPLIATSLRLLG